MDCTDLSIALYTAQQTLQLLPVGRRHFVAFHAEPGRRKPVMVTRHCGKREANEREHRCNIHADGLDRRCTAARIFNGISRG